MRSLITLIVCTGLIAWAHAGKHKYFGLRAVQPTAPSIATLPEAPAHKTDLSLTTEVSNTLFHLPAVHSVLQNSLRVTGRDSLVHGHLLASGLSRLRLMQ